MAHVSINGVKARGNELTEQAVERGNELKTQVLERSNELRDRAVEVAERTRGAAGQVSKSRWAKLAGSGLALIRARAKDAELVNQPRNVSFQLVTLASGVIGGALAGVVFNRIWRAVSGTEQAPEPASLDHSMREVLVAGALQGAVFGLVKAAVGRVTAKGYQRFTGGNDPRS
ncbi:MAG TPA: DUF4235 domain-containing protein [Pseudonocardiaceae bacterium]|jgi:hypothetical protein